MTATTLRASVTMFRRWALLLGLIAIGVGIGYGFSIASANQDSTDSEALANWNHNQLHGVRAISGYEQVAITYQFSSDDPGELFDPAMLKCSEGIHLLGGGMTVSNPEYVVTEDVPAGTASHPFDWHGKVLNQSDDNDTGTFVTFHALCATVDLSS